MDDRDLDQPVTLLWTEINGSAMEANFKTAREAAKHFVEDLAPRGIWELAVVCDTSSRTLRYKQLAELHRTGHLTADSR